MHIQFYSIYLPPFYILSSLSPNSKKTVTLFCYSSCLSEYLYIYFTIYLKILYFMPRNLSHRPQNPLSFEQQVLNRY